MEEEVRFIDENTILFRGNKYVAVEQKGGPDCDECVFKFATHPCIRLKCSMLVRRDARTVVWAESERIIKRTTRLLKV